MKLFAVEGKNVELSESALVIPELKELLYYKSEHKGKGFDRDSIGFKAIMYISLFYDSDSYYCNMESSARKKELIRVCFQQGEHKTQQSRIDELFDSKTFKDACNKVLELLETHEERMLRIYLKKADEITNWIEYVNTNEDNVDKIVGTMKKVSETIDLIKKEREKVRESKKTSKIVGGREQSFLELHKNYNEEIEAL